MKIEPEKLKKQLLETKKLLDNKGTYHLDIPCKYLSEPIYKEYYFKVKLKNVYNLYSSFPFNKSHILSKKKIDDINKALKSFNKIRKNDENFINFLKLFINPLEEYVDYYQVLVDHFHIIEEQNNLISKLKLLLNSKKMHGDFVYFKTREEYEDFLKNFNIFVTEKYEPYVDNQLDLQKKAPLHLVVRKKKFFNKYKYKISFSFNTDLDEFESWLLQIKDKEIHMSGMGICRTNVEIFLRTNKRPSHNNTFRTNVYFDRYNYSKSIYIDDPEAIFLAQLLFGENEKLIEAKTLEEIEKEKNVESITA